jgi:hypothetical protein
MHLKLCSTQLKLKVSVNVYQLNVICNKQCSQLYVSLTPNTFLTLWQCMFEDYKKQQDNLELPKCSAALDLRVAGYSETLLCIWIIIWGWNGILPIFLFHPKLHDITSQTTVTFILAAVNTSHLSSFTLSLYLVLFTYYEEFWEELNDICFPSCEDTKNCKWIIQSSDQFLLF